MIGYFQELPNDVNLRASIDLCEAIAHDHVIRGACLDSQIS